MIIPETKKSLMEKRILYSLFQAFKRKDHSRRYESKECGAEKATTLEMLGEKYEISL